MVSNQIPRKSRHSKVIEYSITKYPNGMKVFLRLAGEYHRFIKKFCSFFQSLKYLLYADPVLQYPDFPQSLYLTTDTRNGPKISILYQGTHPKQVAPSTKLKLTISLPHGNY